MRRLLDWIGDYGVFVVIMACAGWVLYVIISTTDEAAARRHYKAQVQIACHADRGQAWEDAEGVVHCDKP